MIFITGILTVVLVLDCLLLILLVLIQLPKKDAGAGLAFGGAATDALFGAGSGNALTKITKYAAVVFFVLAMLLAVLQRTQRGGRTADFTRSASSPPPPVTAPAAAPAAASGLPATAPLLSTNAPVTPPSDGSTPAGPK